MKDGTYIIAFIVLVILWPTWLERRARGVTFWACWFAPVAGFFMGWWAR